jgi:hypothetical protein
MTSEQVSAGELMLPMIRKNLEDFLAQNEELEGGRFHRDLEEVEEIAKNLGFLDLQERFDIIYKAIGRANAHKKRVRVEKDRREDDFEKYLIRDNNLEKIEPGLRFIDNQFRLLSGRPDLKALDSEQRKVYLELKINGEDVDSQIREVHRHLNGDKNARVIFVAPEITPRFYFSFQKEIEEGRLTLRTVQEVKRGQEYNFSSFDPSEYLRRAEEISDEEERRNKKRTKRRDTGIVNVGGKNESKNGKKKNENGSSDSLVVSHSFQDNGDDTHRPEHVDVAFPKKGISEESYEEYKRNAPGYPKFYNILILYGIIDGDRKKHLVRRKTTEVIRKELERLVSCFELEDQLEHSDRTRVASQKAVIVGKADSDGRYFLPLDRCSSQDERFITEANSFENDTRAKFYQMIKIISDHLLYPRNCNYHINPNEEFGNISDQISPTEDDMANRWKSMDIEQRMKVIEQMGARFDEVMGGLDRGDSGRIIGGFCRLVNRVAFDRPEEEREFAKEAVKFRYARIFSEFLKLKLRRTRQLLRVDRNLAEAYFTYSIPSEHHLNQIVHGYRGPCNVVFNSQLLADFVRRDQEVYGEILRHIDIEEKVELDKLRGRPLFYQIMALHGVPANIRDKYLEPLVVNPTSSNGSDIPFELIEDFEKHMRETRDLYELNSRVAHAITCDKGSNVKPDPRLAKLVQRTRLSLLEVINELGEDSEKLLYYFKDGNEHSLEEFERERQAFEQKLIKYPSKYSEAISASKRLTAQTLAACVNGRALIREIEKKSVFFKEFSMLNAFLKIKIARARDLKDVDENLSQAYLSTAYGDYAQMIRNETGREVNPKLFQRLSDGPPGYVMEMDEFFRYVGFEDQVYMSIRDMIVERHSMDHDRSNDLNGNCNGNDNNSGLTAYEKLSRAICGRSIDHYSCDKRARIKAFVDEEVVQHPVDLDALRKSFCHARLGTRIIGVDDLRVRNFFDDIKLDYLIHGKIPTAQQLNDLYDKDCGSNGK